MQKTLCFNPDQWVQTVTAKLKEDPRDSTLQSGNINTNPKDKKVVYGYTYTEMLGNILPTTSIAFRYVHF